MAEALETVSHDRWTSMLHGTWSGHVRGFISGQTLLERAFRTRSVASGRPFDSLFVLTRGFLIVDDTVIPKPCATAIDGGAWVGSARDRKPVWDLSVVLLIWTDGQIRIPLGFRIWRKGGPSKYDLALALRSDAQNRCTVARSMSSSMPGIRRKSS